MENILLKELDWKDTDYVSLPKVWVEKLKSMKSYEEQEAFFYKAIADKKKDISYEIENMEENLVEFKAFGLSYRRELNKIYDEQVLVLEKMWEESNLSNGLYKKITEMRNAMSPIIKEVKELNDGLKNVDSYRIDKLIETMNNYGRLSGDQKELLKLMLSDENKLKY